VGRDLDHANLEARAPSAHSIAVTDRAESGYAAILGTSACRSTAPSKQSRALASPESGGRCKRAGQSKQKSATAPVVVLLWNEPGDLVRGPARFRVAKESGHRADVAG
jgi:hypothetical protein